MSIPFVLLRRVRPSIIPYARVCNRLSLYNAARGATLRRPPLFWSVILARRGGLESAQQPIDPPQLVLRGGLQGPGADPPGGVNLVPAVRRVVHPRADDFDSRPDLGYEHATAVPRDDLDDQRPVDALIAASEQFLLAGVEPDLDVEVAVVQLRFHLLDDADRDAAAAFHLQPLRVVDADERRAGAAMGRGRRDGTTKRAPCHDRSDHDRDEQRTHRNH